MATGSPRSGQEIELITTGCKVRQIEADEQLIIWIEGQIRASPKEQRLVRVLKRVYARFLGIRYVESV